MKAKTRVNSTAALELEDPLRPAHRLSLWHDAFVRLNQPEPTNLRLVVKINQIIYHYHYRLLFSALHCLFASKHTCCDIRGPLVTVRGNSFRFQYSCWLCKQIIQTHPVQKKIQCKVDLQIFWKLRISHFICNVRGFGGKGLAHHSVSFGLKYKTMKALKLNNVYKERSMNKILKSKILIHSFFLIKCNL